MPNYGTGQTLVFAFCRDIAEYSITRAAVPGAYEVEAFDADGESLGVTGFQMSPFIDYTESVYRKNLTIVFSYRTYPLFTRLWA